MNKKMLMVLTALTFGAATLSAASAAPMTYVPRIENSADVRYSSLYTEASWQEIRIPLSVLGGTLPGSNLTLTTTGLPDGVTLTLSGVTQQDQYAVLSIDTERADTSYAVNALANVTLKAGDTVLTTFQVPVTGTAIDPASTVTN